MPAMLSGHLEAPEEVDRKSQWKRLVQGLQDSDDYEAHLLDKHVNL